MSPISPMKSVIILVFVALVALFLLHSAETTTETRRQIPSGGADSQSLTPRKDAAVPKIRLESEILRIIGTRRTPRTDEPPPSRAAEVAAIRTLLDELDLGRPTDRRDAAELLLDDVDRGLGRRETDPVALARTAVADVLDSLGAAEAAHAGTRLLAPAVTAIAVPAGHLPLTWAALGGFAWDEDTPLPPEVRARDGQAVALTGYMIGTGAHRDAHDFLLVESLWTCCFGRPPELHQVVLARIPPGQVGVEVQTRPVLVVGRLEVGPEYQDGVITSVHRLVVSDCRPIE